MWPFGHKHIWVLDTVDARQRKHIYVCFVGLRNAHYKEKGF